MHSLTFVLFALAAAGVAIHLLTAWIAQRTEAPEFRESPQDEPTPPPPGSKSWTIQEQVTSKIHWDTPPHEVLAWLEDKHHISGKDADRMLATAIKKRKLAVRERALYGMFISGIGILATGVPIVLEIVGGFVMVAKTVVLLAGFCTSSFWFFKYLFRLATGNTTSPVDS
jgi:hypothetical protein